jgi:hypothetical protein
MDPTTKLPKKSCALCPPGGPCRTLIANRDRPNPRNELFGGQNESNVKELSILFGQRDGSNRNETEKAVVDSEVKESLKQGCSAT